MLFNTVNFKLIAPSLQILQQEFEQELENFTNNEKHRPKSNFKTKSRRIRGVTLNAGVFIFDERAIST